MRVRSISFAALSLCLVFAAGCGQKGPLYLPGNPSEIRTEVPRQQPPEEPRLEDDEEQQDDEYRY